MMLRLRAKLVLFTTIVFLAQFVKADEPASNQVTQTNDMAKLLERIDQLAKRLEDLEQRLEQKQPEATNVPNPLSEPQNFPNLGSQPPNGYAPNYYIAPSTNDPFPQHSYSAPPTAYQYPPHLDSSRRPEPGNSPVPYQNLNQPNQRRRPKAVPKSWKPFNFNGMEYYIIPVQEAERLNRHDFSSDSNTYRPGIYGADQSYLRDQVPNNNFGNPVELNPTR